MQCGGFIYLLILETCSDLQKLKGDCEQSDDDWPCKVGDRMCWNETNFRHALREECRRKVFEIQSRLPLLLPCNKKYLAILTNLLFVAYLIVETPDGANVRTGFSHVLVQNCQARIARQ